MGKIVGVGAVMIHANDPPALAQWYGDMLGIQTEYSEEDGCYYGELEDPGRSRITPFGIYPAQGILAGNSRAVMVNYRVDDLEEYVRELQQRGVSVEKVLAYEYGKFGYVTDPEGNPIELWEDIPVRG